MLSSIRSAAFRARPRWIHIVANRTGPTHSTRTHNDIPKVFGVVASSRSSSTAAYQHIALSKHELQHGRGNVARLELANPKKLNIASSDTLAELTSALQSLKNDPKLRVMILTGQSGNKYTPSFCGGANINEMHSISSPEQARTFITKIYEVCESLRALPAVTIAAIDGLCLGAGMEMVAACDFRLATKRSLFAMPEVEIGIPSVVHARSLANIVGWQEARKLLYYATKFDGEAARNIGFVDDIIERPEDLDGMVQRHIDTLSAHGLKAMHTQKKLFNAWEDCSYSEGLLKSIDSFAEAYEDGGVEPRALMGKWIEKQKQRKR